MSWRAARLAVLLLPLVSFADAEAVEREEGRAFIRLAAQESSKGGMPNYEAFPSDYVPKPARPPRVEKNDDAAPVPDPNEGTPAQKPHIGGVEEKGGAGKTVNNEEHGAGNKAHGDAAPSEAHPEAAAVQKSEEDKGWFSSLLPGFLGGGSSEDAKAQDDKAGEEKAPGDGKTPESHAKGNAGEQNAHGETKSSEHAPADGAGPAHQEGAGDHPPAEASKAEGGGGWFSSLLPGFLGGSSPEDAHQSSEKTGGEAEHGKPDEAHKDAASEHGTPEEHAAQDGGHGESSGHGESGGHGGTHGEAPPVKVEPTGPRWPETPAVEADRQPYILVRKLRSIQDRVARGSAQDYELLKRSLRDLSEEMRALPPEVWDDTRNVRAAVFYVLTGGDPRVLTIVAGRKIPPFVERRLVRGALAYGEGRTLDANGLLAPIAPRSVDPALAGIVALIKGTLVSKKDPTAAKALFDEARLFAPGTLIEEAALRQQILLHARDGELARFDQLSSQYSRRFKNSLFARNYRRQFFSGVARQDFKGALEWISRTETELQKLAPGERAAMYLSVASESIKGGHIEIAKFAAENARKLYREGTREHERAVLYNGAALVATEQLDDGFALLQQVDAARLSPQDRELYESASFVAGQARKWPEPAADGEGEMPATVSTAQELLTSVDNMLNGSTE